MGNSTCREKWTKRRKNLLDKHIKRIKDGSVVEWVGAEDLDKPASVTTVNSKEMNQSKGTSNNSAMNAPAEEAANASSLSLYFSIAALILGAIALVFAIKRNRG
jgi:uncharacterized protein YcnI